MFRKIKAWIRRKQTAIKAVTEADDILSVMMLMLAVTNISEATVLSQLLGAAIVGGAQMLIALCGKKRMGIGGADIKLSTAAALLLGFYKGVIGFMLGLLIAVVAQLIITHRKKEQRTQPFPYRLLRHLQGQERVPLCKGKLHTALQQTG